MFLQEQIKGIIIKQLRVAPIGTGSSREDGVKKVVDRGGRVEWRRGRGGVDGGRNQYLGLERRNRRSPDTAGMTDSNSQNASIPHHCFSSKALPRFVIARPYRDIRSPALGCEHQCPLRWPCNCWCFHRTYRGIRSPALVCDHYEGPATDRTWHQARGRDGTKRREIPFIKKVTPQAPTRTEQSTLKPARLTTL